MTTLMPSKAGLLRCNEAYLLTHRSGQGRMTWKDRHFYSIQFEIFQSMGNAVFKHISLIAIKGGTVVASMLLVLLLKLQQIQDRPITTIAQLVGYMGITAVFTIVAMYAACVLLGGLKGTSVALLDEIEQEMMLHELKIRQQVSTRGRKFESVRRAARRYRRRPVRIQLSIFFKAEEGMEVDYLLTVLETTINWLFMVKIPAYIWLLDG